MRKTFYVKFSVKVGIYQFKYNKGLYIYTELVEITFHIIPTLRPRRLSSRGSGILLTNNRADQRRLSNVVQLRGGLPRVENGNKY